MASLAALGLQGLRLGEVCMLHQWQVTMHAMHATSRPVAKKDVLTPTKSLHIKQHALWDVYHTTQSELKHHNAKPMPSQQMQVHFQDVCIYVWFSLIQETREVQGTNDCYIYWLRANAEKMWHIYMHTHTYNIRMHIQPRGNMCIAPKIAVRTLRDTSEEYWMWLCFWVDRREACGVEDMVMGTSFGEEGKEVRIRC